MGLGSPAVLALFCIPILLSNLGEERFALLALLWAFLGTASLFDFGLGRALTVRVAALRVEGDGAAVAAQVKAGLFALALIGAFFALLVGLCSAWIAGFVDRRDVDLGELSDAVAFAAPAVFLVVVGSGVSASLEGFARFDASNIVRIVVAVGTLGGATVWSWRSNSLSELALALVITRSISLFCGAWFLRRQVLPQNRSASVAWGDVANFVSFGKWMTAANLLSPVLSYGDRFALSALIPAATISYYIVPYDIVTRMLIVPSAIMSSLLPTFAREPDRDRRNRLLTKGFLSIAALMLPAMTAAAVVAQPALAWWISEEFAARSAPVAQLICLGVAFNSLAALPFTYLQASGRSRTVVLVQLFEIPFYVIALAVLGSRYGVLGVAATWSFRVGADCLLLWGVVLAPGRSEKSALRQCP